MDFKQVREDQIIQFREMDSTLKQRSGAKYEKLANKRKVNVMAGSTDHKPKT